MPFVDPQLQRLRQRRHQARRTTSASCLPKSSSTKSLRSPRRRGSSGAMPMRSRGVVLRPDARPRCSSIRCVRRRFRSRESGSGRAAARLRPRRSSGPTRPTTRAAQVRPRAPIRSGSCTSAASRDARARRPTDPLVTRASPSRFHASKRQTSARWSTTHQPTLCRVRSYSFPGFPSPTMTFMASSSCGADSTAGVGRRVRA